MRRARQYVGAKGHVRWVTKTRARTCMQVVFHAAVGLMLARQRRRERYLFLILTSSADEARARAAPARDSVERNRA
jgi:hypothetical protein